MAVGLAGNQFLLVFQMFMVVVTNFIALVQLK
jgi:hypothetical protein